MVVEQMPQIVLEGGTGGKFNVAVFSKYNNKGISSRVFLKYASLQAPADTSFYEEKSNTMVEPGYGPHAHFNKLKPGTYYFFASGVSSGNLVKGDIVLSISDSSSMNQDIYIHLK